MPETSDIKRRVSILESQMSVVSRVIRRMSELMRLRSKEDLERKPVNAKSTTLSHEESSTFRRQMAAHGMEDEESRDNTPKYDGVEK